LLRRVGEGNGFEDGDNAIGLDLVLGLRFSQLNKIGFYFEDINNMYT
jgi:hypothetical protein